MKIRKVNFKSVSKFIDTYRKMNSCELNMIKAKWAVGDKRSKMFNDPEGYSIFLVNIEELISKVDFGEMGFEKMNPSKLFTNVDISDFRIAKILEHWRNGGYVDPPALYLNSFNQLYISDGRHRTISAFHLGEKNIPVAVPCSLIEDVAKKINLKD